MRFFFLALFALGGCNGGGFLKDIESRAYDSAALAASEYCERGTNPILANERLEARREVRQRGTHGPLPPAEGVSGLDAHTAAGDGPVVRIWCQDERVPQEVWKDLVKPQ